MRLHVAKRTYIGPNEIDSVERSVNSLAQDAELSRRYEGVDLTFIPTVSGALSEDPERITRLFESIRKTGWKIPSGPYNQTAGQKFSSHLFGTRSDDNADITALMCLDQFPLEREEHWEALMGLASKLHKDNKTYATGSRNVEVALGVHPSNSGRRIIHEMIHTFAGGTDEFRTSLPLMFEANPHPAYARFGESTSGLYLINRNGGIYPDLKKEVDLNEDIAAMNGFAIEYVAAIFAANKGQVSNGYVYAVRNPFYHTPTEDEERAKILTWIGNQTAIVGRTSVRPLMIAALSKGENLEQLSSFFDKELVDETSRVMMDALR
ncbi:MAG: hypothetical protein AABW89_01460 [Nanoarchaeota archaeon]